MKRMDAMKLACEVVGGVSALSRRLGLKPPTVHQWVTGGRPVPANVVPEIERATGNAVRRWDLRPDDWWKIWPELIAADGAPAVPSSAPTEQAA